MEPLTTDPNDALIALAAVSPLLVGLFFLFRAVPWSKPGSWRKIWALGALASLMFIAAEGVVLTERGMQAVSTTHQLPLFAGFLAAAGGFFLVYLDGYRAAERTRTLALTDALTSLPNLRAFQARLEVALERKENFSLAYVDIDGFKRVNDTLGHTAGDALLCDLGALFRQSVRDGDLAARVGGDEFALLLVNADPTKARMVAERALTGLRALSARLPQGLTIGGSFGIATSTDGRSARGLVDLADTAMYRAKRAGGNRLAFASQPVLVELTGGG